MKYLIIFLILPSITFAQQVKHLKVAIKLNKERAPLYSALSDGESLAVSHMLIASQTKALQDARSFNFLSSLYRVLGYSIGRAEFISMDTVPEFSETYSFTPEPLNAFKEIDGDLLKQKLHIAFKDGFAALSRTVEAELKDLEVPKAYNCMTRHLLESILRTSNLAVIHLEKFKEKKLKLSPEWLSKEMIVAQLDELAATTSLDAVAAPIQALNIPIICNDLPHIPAN